MIVYIMHELEVAEDLKLCGINHRKRSAPYRWGLMLFASGIRPVRAQSFRRGPPEWHG